MTSLGSRHNSPRLLRLAQATETSSELSRCNQVLFQIIVQAELELQREELEKRELQELVSKFFYHVFKFV